ncbi:hypothetical protein [Thalassovita mediterranea]|jgi:hypothetical protein|uniref:STAS domain-containing protein n=1 Tax=Thalassovita mediterranea TaxID=340021 RepID=A0A0P1H387_9RHOB|nr:hypothetical protein [Thalassovita mediterranea]CUH83206.1 hypothetical protein TM5383_00390 [Thalassovita mediterranea]SIS33506.1 hypothetical protein SAMN05421685_108119 [Thalassovita mediterranea]
MAALIHFAHPLELVFIRYEGHHTAQDADRIYDALEGTLSEAPYSKFFVDLSGVTSSALCPDDLRHLQRRLTVCASARRQQGPSPLMMAYFAPTAPAQQVGRICTGRWNLHPDFISATSHLRQDCAILLNVPEAALAELDTLPYQPV